MTEENKDEQFEFDSTGLTTKEKHWGEKRFSDYKDRYHIENLSDLQLLSELVFREALQRRYKKQAEKNSKSKTTSEDGGKVPTYILKTLDENLVKIIELKKELGLLQVEKGKDLYDYINQLKRKFQLWREENQGSRQVVCPFCSKLFFLMIRTDKYEAKKSPFFRDKILANKHLWFLYREGKITKEDVARVLGTSPDYVDWLEQRIFSKDSE